MSNKHNGIDGLARSAKTLNIGHGNFLLTSRIVAILESGSLPMKRLRENATQGNLLVDATAGRKTRSIILTDSRHVVLSALAPHTLQERLQAGPQLGSLADLEWEEGEFVS
jgi:regulator of extracellular matrix RemA (YlzA/DUF370 family)